MDSTTIFECIVTNLGLAKIAAAVTNGTAVNISQIAIGDGGGNSVSPDPNQAGLVREVYRAGINSLTRDTINPNYIICELVIPPDVGGWTVREFGVFDNSGALVAVGQYPDSYKPLPTQGAARDMIIRVIIQISDSATVNLIIDGNLVLASRQWVTDNFGAAALFPGGTTGEVLAKKSNADGDTEWVDPAGGLHVTVDVKEETQTLADGQAVVNLATVTTHSMAVYINGDRLRADQFAVNGDTQITLVAAGTSGQKLTAVQNEPAGAAQFLGKANNLSDVPDKAAARLNLGVLNQQEMIQAMLQFQYPVGEVYVTRRIGNPADLLGFGAWTRYAPGRALIGLDPTDAACNAVDVELGEKTHVLSLAELPTHTHTVSAQTINTGAVGDHSHVVDPPSTGTSTGGAHIHHLTGTGGAYGGLGIVGTANQSLPNSVSTDSQGTHSHTVDIAAFNSGAAGSHWHSITIPAQATGAAGSGVGHNNIQPSKVVNFWLRTA